MIRFNSFLTGMMAFQVHKKLGLFSNQANYFNKIIVLGILYPTCFKPIHSRNENIQPDIHS